MSAPRRDWWKCSTASIGAGTRDLCLMVESISLTETQTMVAKLPVMKGKTDTVTMMSYGFDPYLSSWSPYHGAVYAVVTESMAKIVAAGGDYQEDPLYLPGVFPENDRVIRNAGASLLQLCLVHTMPRLDFGLPSIGGKDSMSGYLQ